MQLSFSHIMKHWKRNPGQGGSRQMAAGGRNVLLRFYPPQNAQGWWIFKLYACVFFFLIYIGLFFVNAFF